MFGRFISKKRIGGGLVLFGMTALIGMAGTDDVAVANGVHSPIVPLILKGILFLAMMAVGAVLVGGDPDENRD